MSSKLFISLILILISLAACQTKEVTIQCTIETELGAIALEIFPEKAPITVENFLNYVDKHAYDGCNFFRVCTPENEKERHIKIEVIQGGDLPETLRLAPIPLESTRQTGIKHTNGTISMARDTPNSAQCDFFICIGKQPELDFGGKRNPDGQGFAAFGRVTKGMYVVKAIQKGQEKDQLLLKPVSIHTIRKTD
ncbi:MAG: peptidylprolyl isomerase [Bacteroidetes bacterium HGW-Bacteroidetes-4]|jgi:peptidyl-prolyl cis-trans isomerase A (cyclophilin A)|nr:MAG: peptidylprolyl isomerase [Bacteroidetes bacterium HGW-Bacteroidetes-4]